MSEKKKAKKAPRVNWRKAAVELASCAVFTLRTGRHLGKGSGITMSVDKKTGKMMPGRRWEEKFFDALDTIGVVYDRNAYYARDKRVRS